MLFYLYADMYQAEKITSGRRYWDSYLIHSANQRWRIRRGHPTGGREVGILLQHETIR